MTAATRIPSGRVSVATSAPTVAQPRCPRTWAANAAVVAAANSAVSIPEVAQSTNATDETTTHAATPGSQEPAAPTNARA